MKRTWQWALVAGFCGALVLSSAAFAARSDQKVVSVRDVKGFGKVLFTLKGQALYTYSSDSKDHSTCEGACLSAWPALEAKKGETLKGAKGLGEFERSAGVYQVTYDGLPLYTFVSDQKWKVTGNAVAGFSVATVKSPSAHHKKTTTSSTVGGY